MKYTIYLLCLPFVGMAFYWAASLLGACCKYSIRDGWRKSSQSRSAGATPAAPIHFSVQSAANRKASTWDTRAERTISQPIVRDAITTRRGGLTGRLRSRLLRIHLQDAQ